MNKERLHIVLNKDIIDQLNLASGQELEAELYAEKLVLQREEEPERRTLSSWVLIIATVLLSVIFFAISSMQNRNQILLVGDYSIITFLIGFGGVLGMAIFTITFILNRHLFLGGLKARVFWRMLPVIILSFTVILLLALLGFGWLLEQIFTGASFDLLTATLI